MPLGIADDLHNWVKDIVATERYLPGKRQGPAEELLIDGVRDIADAVPRSRAGFHY